ncbi:MAG TPA: class I SAM-dependent methyltransferase, partial [Rhodobacterales bacterium]|nr:class I SAM-dependent methyltransferase [Rhodobacterales bacterium]
RHPLAGSLSKAHGKLFWITGASFGDWVASDRQVEGGFITRPGVFSADGPDKGSRALLATLPPLKGRVGDLGAGWGYLARHILEAGDVSHIDLIEADSVALDCARANLSDPRARFIWADATRFSAKVPFDVVVSNPPFHVGRAGDPDLGRAFIAAAARMLTPRGSFWMVANRHLPYEETLAAAFRHVEEVGSEGGFKVFHASHPSRRRA